MPQILKTIGRWLWNTLKPKRRNPNECPNCGWRIKSSLEQKCRNCLEPLPPLGQR